MGTQLDLIFTLLFEQIVKHSINQIYKLTEDVIKRVKELKTGKPIQEAVEGWCPVEGCEQVTMQRKRFFILRFNCKQC
jgi:hypothetical protein